MLLDVGIGGEPRGGEPFRDGMWVLERPLRVARRLLSSPLDFCADAGRGGSVGVRALPIVDSFVVGEDCALGRFSETS